MLIRELTLSDFRNFPRASLVFAGRRQFFAGANGQGKSNLLEAAGFLTALRSFRATDSRHLVMHDRPEAAASFLIEREGMAAERVAVKIRRDGRELWYDGKRVSRLADHVGRFPTVVFSSQDLQLIRGAPSLRRRWLDMTLASIDPDYLAALQAYGRALAGRNVILRRPGSGSTRELSAFDRTLAPSGARIVAMRAGRMGELALETAAAYAAMGGGLEKAELQYDSALHGVTADGLLALLESARERDLAAGATTVGPHRDDVRFLVGGAVARDFASEGQQRSLMLALRLAQAAWFHRRSGVRPVLLADDVLGELDPGRRDRFWRALDPQAQVMATGTSLPDASLGDWEVFSVAGGSAARQDRAMGAAD
jgi:DNA replication and repair protein RecF